MQSNIKHTKYAVKVIKLHTKHSTVENLNFVHFSIHLKSGVLFVCIVIVVEIILYFQWNKSGTLRRFEIKIIKRVYGPVKEDDERRIMNNQEIDAVSYTHLDVYKRQP